MNGEEFLRLLFPKTYEKIVIALDVRGDCSKLKQILGVSYFYKLSKAGVIDRKKCSFSVDFIKELAEGLIILAIYLKPRARSKLLGVYKELINALE